MNIPWIVEAKKHIGTKEYSKGDNPKILKWADLVGGQVKKDYTADSIPWCGLYVAYVFSQVGIEPIDKPLWALSWSNFGKKLSEPAYGCVITFKRNGGGHVGFYMGEDSNYYFVLGGNQSDSVNMTKIAKSRVHAFRWPAGSQFDKFYKKGRVKTNLSKVNLSTNEA